MSNYNAMNINPIIISIEVNNSEKMIDADNFIECKSPIRYEINDFKKQHLDVYFYDIILY